MSNPYVKEPDLNDFKRWMEKDPQQAQDFFEDFILPEILTLELDDYFGTEGFDKRYG